MNAGAALVVGGLAMVLVGLTILAVKTRGPSRPSGSVITGPRKSGLAGATRPGKVKDRHSWYARKYGAGGLWAAGAGTAWAAGSVNLGDGTLNIGTNAVNDSDGH